MLQRNFQHLTSSFRWRIETGGFCQFDEQPTNHRHWHDYHEICLITAGSGIYVWQHSEFPLRAGDIILASPDEAHEISSFETRDLELVFFRFWLELLPGASPAQDSVDKLLHSFLQKHLPFAPSPNCLLYLPLLENAAHQSTYAVHTSQQTILLLLTEMIASLTTDSLSENPTERWPDSLSRASAFINSVVKTRHPAVAEVAEAAGVSSRTLNRLFQKYLGHSPLREVHERRLHFAAQKLAMRFSVSEVSDSMNFDSPPAFSRLFKNHFGLAPREYQQRHAPRAPTHRTSFAP